MRNTNVVSLIEKISCIPYCTFLKIIIASDGLLVVIVAT